VRITAETPEEADLLSRRLPAIRHLLGLEPTTNLPTITAELRELLALELAAVDLHMCYELPAER
jgi:hypothetical protein